jgi:hypothetical protein
VGAVCQSLADSDFVAEPRGDKLKRADVLRGLAALPALAATAVVPRETPVQHWNRWRALYDQRLVSAHEWHEEFCERMTVWFKGSSPKVARVYYQDIFRPYGWRVLEVQDDVQGTYIHMVKV